MEIRAGEGNAAFGQESLDALTEGDSNTGCGRSTGTSITTGSSNTLMGYLAGATINTGSNNVAIGGYYTMYANTTGSNNVAIGRDAMKWNTTGGLQTAIGTYALDASTTGASQGNTAVGYNSMGANTTGYSSVGVGAYALDAMTTAQGNTAVGYAACSTMTTGWQNVGVGHAALEDCTTSTCTGVGYNALYQLSTGDGNTAVGGGAGATTTTGTRNTILGAQSYTSAGDSSHQIVLGYTITGVANSTVTIGSASGTASLSLDGSDTSWAAASDERLKENITTSTAGLSFINDLRPITFNWKKAGEVPEDMSQYIEGSEKPCVGPEYGITQHGFVAQEVKTAIDNHPELKEGFNMWQEYDNGTQSIAEGNVVNILVKAVQELSAEVEQLKQQNNNNGE